MARAPSARRDAAGIGLASVGGTALNALKLVLFATLFTATELDLLTAGLLIATTGAQLCGEPLANLAVLRNDRPGARWVALTLPLAFALTAAFPGAVLTVVAPGVDATSHTLEVMRFFSLAGAALVLLWWAAGEAQRRLDFLGFQSLFLVPNAAIVIALCLPVDDRVAAVPVGLTAGCAAMAAYVALRTRRSPVPRTASTQSKRPGRTLVALVALAVAAVANLILLLVFGSLLSPGTLGVLYLSASVLIVPTAAIGGAVGASLLPRWAAAANDDRLAHPEAAARISAGLTAGCAALLVGAFFVVRRIEVVEDSVDPTILSGLATALPIMAAGAALHGAGPVARSYAVARGRIGVMIALATAGAALVPLAYLVSPTLAGLSVGYSLSALPWLAAIPLTRARARQPVLEPLPNAG
jgi:hypothetical protein